MKILDCTLRDGGYYTHWDFDRELVESYLSSMKSLPVDYIEIGYRSVPQKNYEGEYCFLPEATMQFCRLHFPDKKIAVMVNAKDVDEQTVSGLVKPCRGYVDMIRLAVKPTDIPAAVRVAGAVKKLGFEVAFNIMYMSLWDAISGFYDQLRLLRGKVDAVWLVDSFGSVTPEQVRVTIPQVKQATGCAVGFHGHQNLEMAFVNTLAAIESGCDFVDCTVTGMGRGAGNLKTELLLTHVSRQKHVDFVALLGVVEKFDELRQKYNWGVSLPYMISGEYSLPQKDIMAWMSKRRYNVETIVQTLQNGNKKVEAEFAKLDAITADRILIIGGGKSVKQHLNAILAYIEKFAASIVVVFSSSKHLSLFDCLPDGVRRFVCLVGNEGGRLEKQGSSVRQSDVFIINQCGGALTTYVPQFVHGQVRSIAKGDGYPYCDSPLFIALNAFEGMKDVELVGFDGYDNAGGDYELMQENQNIIDSDKRQIVTLLPSKYQNLKPLSIYSLV